MPATPHVAPELPVGTVTFLLTDIEGSTRLWEAVPESMKIALDLHNHLLTEEIQRHGGMVVTSRGEGDSFFAVFSSAASAVMAAGRCQLRLTTQEWPPGVTLRVRMGLHTGEARALEGDYVDHAPINRCARVKAAASGGQVLITKATFDLVRSRLDDGFGLRKLGGFRLRDLTEPELIYQLDHADLASDFPPIRTPSERTSNLPLQVSSFVGRDGEQADIEALLGRARAVTLTGPGGVGKTRLALEAASQAAPRFVDGVWLCELAAVRDQTLVDEAVAAVFAVSAPAGTSIREGLAGYLRSRSTLLVLDNCEHVLGEAASLAAMLVRSCEHLVILATSREGLAIEGERVVPVAPLAVPPAGADLAAITQAEAVRLFAERAAAVKPGFTVTEQNAAAVAGVVRRLDGLALAIELAAARTPAMTPAELGRRLERSFAVLARAARGADERHQTLRATIDWSFTLLTEPEQLLLCRLSVFAGDATLEAVEGVCGGDGLDPGDVFELLASLVSRSLVVAEEHGSRTRYRLLETVRQYGEDRLDQAGQRERWQARHAAHYADLLERVRQPDPGDDAFWALRLSAAQDNLLQAWSWAIRTGDIDTALKILTGFASSEMWSSFPLILPGDAALELPGAAEHPRYALALGVSAVFASSHADVDRAEHLCRLALDANADLASPDWRVEQAVLAARAHIATMNGDFVGAALLHEQAAALARAGGDLADVSVELTTAVANYVLAEQGARGVPLSREALDVARQIDAPDLIATALLEVGSAIVETDPGRARECLRESRELSEGLGYRKARDLVWAAGLSFLLGDRSETLELCTGALRSLQRSGDRFMTGVTMQLVAGTLAAIQPDSAATIMGAAEAYVISSSRITLIVGAAVATSLGEQSLDRLRTRGAAMPWEQAVTYTLAQAQKALAGSRSQSQEAC